MCRVTPVITRHNASNRQRPVHFFCRFGSLCSVSGLVEFYLPYSGAAMFPCVQHAHIYTLVSSIYRHLPAASMTFSHFQIRCPTLYRNYSIQHVYLYSSSSKPVQSLQCLFFFTADHCDQLRLHPHKLFIHLFDTLTNDDVTTKARDFRTLRHLLMVELTL